MPEQFRRMHKQKKISRKIFIQTLSAISIGMVGWIWYRISRFQTESENRMEFIHGQDIPMGISYFGKYYLFRSENDVRAFLTKCTHAGCRIAVSSGIELQCNCHGSKFEAESGKPLKGPAIRPLQEIECRLDEKTGQWVVSLKHAGFKSSLS